MLEAGQRFCREMSRGARLPKHPVYGANNWYYAYGQSSGQEIEAVRDSDEWTVIPDGSEVRLQVKPRRINVFTAGGERSLVIREELL